MNRRVTGAVAAVVLATVGAAGLVAFVKGAEERALAGERLVDVVVVKTRIDAGTAAEDVKDHVRAEQVPAKTRAAGAVADVEALAGRVAGVDLLPGEQLTTERFVEPSVFSRTRGQVDVPDGLLEVTISLEPERAVGGVLRPGSTVGVVASFDSSAASGGGTADGQPTPAAQPEGNDSSHLILHKVLVTNVQSARSFEMGIGDDKSGDGDSQTAPAPTENLLVTLALDAPSVERVVFAAEHGEVWLAYEPKEAGEEGTRVQTHGSVYQ